jgi:hypothetical protein
MWYGPSMSVNNLMREMPFIYRGHQGPVPKGHLDWKWLNKMFSLHTICFFRQDDGDAGDDDVSSDDNTDILSSL